MNQSKVSARYYLFEEVIEESPGFAALRTQRSMADLAMLAGIVWANEGGAPGKCPILKTRPKNDTSYFEAGKPGTICLAPKHQNIGGLLHEMAHALGTRDKLTHGPAFRKRCLRFYKDYGGWSGEVDFEAKR